MFIFFILLLGVRHISVTKLRYYIVTVTEKCNTKKLFILILRRCNTTPEPPSETTVANVYEKNGL